MNFLNFLELFQNLINQSLQCLSKLQPELHQFLMQGQPHILLLLHLISLKQTQGYPCMIEATFQQQGHYSKLQLFLKLYPE